MPAVGVALERGVDYFALLPRVGESERAPQSLNLIEGVSEILKDLARFEGHADVGDRAITPGSVYGDDCGWNPAAGHQGELRNTFLHQRIAGRAGFAKQAHVELLAHDDMFLDETLVGFRDGWRLVVELRRCAEAGADRIHGSFAQQVQGGLIIQRISGATGESQCYGHRDVAVRVQRTFSHW